MMGFKIGGVSFFVNCKTIQVYYRTFCKSRSGAVTEVLRFHDWYDLMDDSGTHLKLTNRLMNGHFVEPNEDIIRHEKLTEIMSENFDALYAYDENNNCVFKYVG